VLPSIAQSIRLVYRKLTFVLRKFVNQGPGMQFAWICLSILASILGVVVDWVNNDVWLTFSE